MEVYIKITLNRETLKKLEALLPDAEITATAEAPSAPEEKPVAKAKSKKAEAPAPANADKPKTEEITKTDIRAVALKLSKAGKQKELAEVFAKFGCKKLSDFDSHPEDFPELMRELVSVNA